MLNVGTVNVPACDGVTRRSFLQIGTAGLASLALPNLMKLQASGAIDPQRARIKLHHDLPGRLAGPG